MTCFPKTAICSDMKQLPHLTSRILLTLALIAGTAFGADLDQAKRDGLVGERADGYLGLVQSEVAQDVAQLVKDVNAKRRAEYQRIAAANDLTLEEVQALAGQKTIERTAAGHWIMANGGWKKK